MNRAISPLSRRERVRVRAVESEKALPCLLRPSPPAPLRASTEGWSEEGSFSHSLFGWLAIFAVWLAPISPPGTPRNIARGVGTKPRVTVVDWSSGFDNRSTRQLSTAIGRSCDLELPELPHAVQSTAQWLFDAMKRMPWDIGKRSR